MTDRPIQRCRPMSAKPFARPMSAKRSLNRSPQLPADDDAEGDSDDGIVLDDEEDEGEGEFGDEYDHVQQPRQYRPSSAGVRPTGFRPKSAPVSRPKPAPVLATQEAKQQLRTQRERAAVSIGYLKLAAAKKKRRDAHFAQELIREDNEFKKKITLKIEQANKMCIASGSKRSFSSAPDRDGVHMIKVIDPANTSDRVISVETFLREFERLASVPIGHMKSSTSTSKLGSTVSSSIPTNESSTKASKVRLHAIRMMHHSSSSADLTSVEANANNQRSIMSNSKRLITKSTDRTLVQEELKSVLANTIELTKVLQDQLHELKLKGWNFSSRISAASS